MAVVNHNTHCRAKSSGNAIQVRVTTEEMSGERYMGCTGEMGWMGFPMVLRTRTWLPLRGYLALRGVGGTSTRRLKRIGWRLDLTKPQHTTPTYHSTRSCNYSCS